jgi:hypothetical protein
MSAANKRRKNIREGSERRLSINRETFPTLALVVALRIPTVGFLNITQLLSV